MTGQETDRGRVWVLDLPWSKPPLSLNQRLHHMAKYRLEKSVQTAAHLLARSHNIPELGRCRVELVYEPVDRRRRDEDNLVATLKPLCDGLVSAEVVPDDTPAFMEKPSPRIGEPRRPARLVLIVTELLEGPAPVSSPVVVERRWLP